MDGDSRILPGGMGWGDRGSGVWGEGRGDGGEDGMRVWGEDGDEVGGIYSLWGLGFGLGEGKLSPEFP